MSLFAFDCECVYSTVRAWMCAGIHVCKGFLSHRLYSEMCNPLLRESEDFLSKSIFKEKNIAKIKEINTTIVFLRRHNICTVAGVAECREVELQSDRSENLELSASRLIDLTSTLCFLYES